jgi:two-component system sensor histidine kinase MtrB
VRRRWRLGHRARATATFAVGAAIISALFGAAAYAASRSYLTQQRETAARDRVYLNARATLDQLRAPQADAGEVLTNLAPEEGATAFVLVDGRWFSSSVAVEVDDVPEGVLADASTSVAAWQRYSLRGEPQLAVAVPLPAVDAVYAEVVPLAQLRETLRTLGTALLGGAGFAVLVGASVGFFAAGRLVRPLRRLSEQAEAIAAGRAQGLDVAVDDPDLEPLVRSLNQLLEGSAQRAEQGSRFVSDVSHEIRAPLAALAAALAVMRRRRSQLPERSAQALDLLGEQIDEFQQLVLDLLEISRIDAGRAELLLQPTSCRELVAHAAASVDATVEISVDPDVPPAVLLDRRRMAQVLVNLIENARRYAGGATAIDVQRPSASILAFVVRDRGPGVPNDERVRIFGRFERGEHGERGPSGTGLGLALVAEHAALHGGHVRVQDARGGGAEFVVEVSLCEPDA